MKPRLRFLVGIFLFMPFFAFAQMQNCVDFESQVLGTNYGNGINAQGEVIFTQNDIPVTVEYFEWVGGGGTFGTATILASIFGSANSMWTNNINLGFDFSGLGYTPNKVRFYYADFGGFENISVNGEPIFAGELDKAPMPPGITLVISDLPLNMKQATLYGPVQSLVVGGQEFQIDDICATLIEDLGPCVEFETLFSGQNFGNGINAQGDVILTENDIDVSVEYFEWIGGGGTFGTATVIDGNPYFNTDQAMWTSNINLKFDFTNYTTMVNWVSFDYVDQGGEENFSLNGLPIFVGEIEDWLLPPQFTLGIADMGTYKHVEIIGTININSFLVGGQEYAIDNLCAGYLEDPSECVDFELLPVGAEFGDGFNPMGSMIFEENEIDVYVEWFEWVGGGGTYGNCWVIDGDPTYGTGNAMWTSNINLRFDFSARSDADAVRFDYNDSGGNENIGINGHPLYVGEISTTVLPGGFNIVVQNSGLYSTAFIFGPEAITDLVVGGQEFTIDNVCIAVSPGYDEHTQNSSAQLGQNYPNPISGQTMIPFKLTEGCHVVLTVYDHLGREVSVLADEEFVPGEYELNFDATNLPDGIYFYQLRTIEGTQTMKMVVR